MMLHPITIPAMSLWELGHRMAGINPYRLQILPLTPALKDAFRTLVSEIYAHRLDSSLIYEKYRVEHGLDRDSYLRTHLRSIWDIQSGRRYSRRFLKSVAVQQTAFLFWCEQMGYPKPRFWDFLNIENLNAVFYGSQEEQDAEMDDMSSSERISLIKYWVEIEAERCWQHDPTLRISHLVNLPKIVELTKHFQRDSVARWISHLAPEGVKGVRGRSKKTT